MNSFIEGIFINYRFVTGRGRILSVHMEQLGLAPNRWIFMKFDILVFFFWKSVKKIPVSLKSQKFNGYCT
jgi:hypothetical protein